MACRSTRNRLRCQCTQAVTNLRKAQRNLVQVAAIADDRSEVINENLPGLIACLEPLIEATEKFSLKI